MSVGLTVPSAVPILGGFSFSFRVQRPLVEALKRVAPAPFYSPNSPQSKIIDPYKIRVETKDDAQQIGRTINDFCAPHIQNWWIETQDQLVREGTRIREELVKKIQKDIQQISTELSEYIGESLEVDLNINPIQFPGFEFKGIDAQVQAQQEVYRKKETKTKCCSDETYEVEAKVDSHRSFYEVDLGETARLIKSKIDEQVSRNLGLLQRVIEKQVSADFRSAEQQINEYIQRFQDELDSLLRDREMKEAEADQIREKLDVQKAALNEYLSEMLSLRESLDSWKPLQAIK
jgi:hypothetical protein